MAFMDFGSRDHKIAENIDGLCKQTSHSSREIHYLLEPGSKITQASMDFLQAEVAKWPRHGLPLGPKNTSRLTEF